MRGDHHMPVGKAKACLLDPHGELEDYRDRGGNAPPARRHKEEDGDWGDDGLNGLEREYGTDAANPVWEHLSLFRMRLDSAFGGGYYSPLNNVKGR
jgi:hypothetical protein